MVKSKIIIKLKFKNYYKFKTTIKINKINILKNLYSRFKLI